MKWLKTLLIITGTLTLTANVLLSQENPFSRQSIQTTVESILEDLETDHFTIHAEYILPNVSKEDLDRFISDFFTVKGLLPGSKIHANRIHGWEISDIQLNESQQTATVSLDVELASQDKGYRTKKKLLLTWQEGGWKLQP